MARKAANTDRDWDDHVVEDHIYIPDDIRNIVGMATELLKTSISDALNFSISNVESIEAIDWLFYSQDNQPWSFGWVIGMLSDISGEINIAAARLALLKNPALLTVKQKFDAISESEWYSITQDARRRRAKARRSNLTSGRLQLPAKAFFPAAVM